MNFDEYARWYIKQSGMLEILVGLLEENERLERENQELRRQSQKTTKRESCEKKICQGHRKKLFGEVEKQEINRMKAEGMSNVEIAKKFHCSESTIRNYTRLYI